MKLINPKMSREEVSNYIVTWICHDCLPYGESQFVMAVDDLDCLPTIDAEPIRHGKWIIIDKEHKESRKCSECGWITKSNGNPDEHDILFTNAYLYCTHCGARMDMER